MSSSVKNFAIALGLITVAFAGYYMYTQKSATLLNTSPSDVSLQDMLANTQVFIERRQELNGFSLDLSLFEDERFLSLKSFSQPVTVQPVGRLNPFLDADDVVLNIQPESDSSD